MRSHPRAHPAAQLPGQTRSTSTLQHTCDSWTHHTPPHTGGISDQGSLQLKAPTPKTHRLGRAQVFLPFQRSHSKIGSGEKRDDFHIPPQGPTRPASGWQLQHKHGPAPLAGSSERKQRPEMSSAHRALTSTQPGHQVLHMPALPWAVMPDIRLPDTQITRTQRKYHLASRVQECHSPPSETLKKTIGLFACLAIWGLTPGPCACWAPVPLLSSPFYVLV